MGLGPTFPIVIQSGLAPGTPSDVNVYTMFAGATPPDLLIDGNIEWDGASSPQQVFIGTHDRNPNVHARSTIAGGATITQGTASNGRPIVIGDGSVVQMGTPPPLGFGNLVCIGADNIIGDGVTDVGGAVVIGPGNTSIGPGTGVVIIGGGNTCPGQAQQVVIGNTCIATAGTSDIVIGNAAVRDQTGTGPNFLPGIAIGPTAICRGPNSIAIGNSAQALNGHSTAIGAGARCALVAGAGSGTQTAIGALANAGTGRNSTVVGYNVRTLNQPGCVGLGSGITFTGPNQFRVGLSRIGASVDDGVITFMQIGGEPTYPSYAGLTWECVNGEGSNNAVGNLDITAPLSTGNAGGGTDTNGAISFRTGETGASGASVQVANTRVVIRQGGGLQVNGTQIAGRANLILFHAGGAEPAAIDFELFPDQAGAAAGTLLNAPSVGDPTFWVPVLINGVEYAIPAWPV